MESLSNNTGQQLPSEPETTRSPTTGEGLQVRSAGPSGAPGDQSNEFATGRANAGEQSLGNSGSGGENATDGLPGDSEPSSSDRLQEQQSRPERRDLFWYCCGGTTSGCSSNSFWLKESTPACLECGHRMCGNCTT
ncbi:hypothetical protein B9Z19DRAFT_1126696 [Tuber borchii]|uniref:Uncharacterized protein n=1 Tax=Tuber borchii TaxID=42251 RepID=A0A2T6ZSI3_TUBBO|nr:hypothetical protein B9Z19DRAFT_1126696 [Tuber borchii]